jgi:hypothetical protein
MNGRLSRVTDWEHLARESGFHPARMASLCSVSQRQFQRFFKEKFRTSPRRWLRAMRCEDHLTHSRQVKTLRWQGVLPRTPKSCPRLPPIPAHPPRTRPAIRKASAMFSSPSPPKARGCGVRGINHSNLICPSLTHTLTHSLTHSPSLRHRPIKSRCEIRGSQINKRCRRIGRHQVGQR